MSIGEKIKYYRKQKGMTQQELAASVGVANTTITGYEKGNREPNAPMIIKIARALGVTGDDLLDLDIKEKTPTEIDKDLKSEVLEQIIQMTPDELDKVLAFVQGILATH